MGKEIVGEEYNELNLMCPIRYTLNIVGGKWKLPIICMLAHGLPIRYGTIKRKLDGVTNMMLSQSLKELEAAKIIDRYQYNEIPPKVEYTLTEAGKSIVPELIKLAEWGKDHMQKDNLYRTSCERCQSMN